MDMDDVLFFLRRVFWVVLLTFLLTWLFMLGLARGAEIQQPVKSSVSSSVSSSAKNVQTAKAVSVVYEISVDDLRKMSRAQIERFLVMMTFAKEYNLGNRSQKFTDELYRKSLPSWIYKRAQKIYKEQLEKEKQNER